jgi:NAD(P)-dependent dehydrogenase (short-subunit alcohol dehydrogenase family)
LIQSKHTDFSKKVVIVTGAARGIGKVVTRRFAQLGARVYAADWKPELLEQSIAVLNEEGLQVSGIPIDVRKEAEVRAAVDRTIFENGHLDVVYNNAGVNTRGGSCTDIEERTLDFTLAVNLKGTFFFCKHAIPVMLKNGGGVIINTSSIAAHFGGLGCDAYAMSKSAVEALTRQIATEFGRRGIRCNVICPGIVRTEGTLGVEQNGEAAEKRLVDRAGPIGRAGNPEEIAELVCHLCSSEAGLINGTTVFADGGYHVMARTS